MKRIFKAIMWLLAIYVLLQLAMFFSDPIGYVF